MTDQDLKKRIPEKKTGSAEQPEKIISPWWVNLYFDKLGHYIKGDFIHPSEKAAAAHARMLIKFFLEVSTCDSLVTSDGVILKEDYSHFMSVPWLKT